MSRSKLHSCFVICLFGASLLLLSPDRAVAAVDTDKTARLATLAADVAEIKRRMLALDRAAAQPSQSATATTADSGVSISPAQSGLRLARLLVANGLYAEAINEIGALPASEDTTIDRHEVEMVRAEALARQGKLQEAESQLWPLCDQSRRVCHQGNALYLLTRVLIEQQRGEEAGLLVQSSLARFDPGDVIKLDIAMMFNHAGMPDIALAVLAGNVLDKAKLVSARIMMDRDNNGSARKILQEINLDGLFGNDARFNLGQLAFTAGHYDQALRYWSGMNRSGLLPLEYLSIYIVQPYAQWEVGDQRLSITGYRSAIDFYERESRAIAQAQALLKKTKTISEALGIDADRISFTLPVPVANVIAGARQNLIIRTDSDSSRLWRLNEDLLEMSALLDDYRQPSDPAKPAASRLQQDIADISRRIGAARAGIRTELVNNLTGRLQARAVVVSSCLDQARYMLARLLDQYNSRPNRGG